MSDLEQAWRHELAVRGVCDALESLTDHIELITDTELLDALTAYLVAVRDYIKVTASMEIK